MLEQLATSIKFLAFFVASKVGKTGLTVTVDVYDPAGTLVVTAGAASAVGGGLYQYTLAAGSVTAEGEYVAIFKTADTTVDQQHIPALWVVGRAGIENLNATIGSRSSHSAADVWTSGTRTLTSFGTLVADTAAAVWAAATRTLTSFGTLAADVWSSTTRTLTQTAAQVTATMEGADLVIKRGDSWSQVLLNVGSLQGATKVWFTVKTAAGLADAASTIQIVDTVGLVYLNGAAATAGQGSLTIQDAPTGDITLTLTAAATATLTPRSYVYDIQALIGSVVTRSEGTLVVTNDVTRAIT